MSKKVFSVDAETNGLYGEVWAIGAVVDGPNDSEMFRGMIDPRLHVTDPWVREHIVPVVKLPMFDSRASLLNSFWHFWMLHRDTSIAIADFGTPVEAGLFRACVELADSENRRWQSPYPLHELGTLLLAHGLDPDLDRRKFIDREDLVAHDPLADALVAQLCWQKVITDEAPYVTAAGPFGAE